MWRGPVGEGANRTRTGLDMILFFAKIKEMPQRKRSSIGQNGKKLIF